MLYSLILKFPAFAQDEDTPIPPEVMLVGRGIIHALDWHPEGNQLAVASAAGAWLLDADLNVTERIAGREMNALAWSPDGTQIALSSMGDCRLLVRDAASNERSFSQSVCGERLIWSPDGSQLVVIQDRTVQVVDLQADTVTVLPLPGQVAVWSADGQRLAISATDSLFAWNFGTDQLEWARIVPGYSDVLRWSDDGIIVLCNELSEARNLSSLCQIDPETGEEAARQTFIFRHPGERSEIRDMHFNPSGDHFSFVVTNQPEGALPNMHIYHTSDHQSFITPGNLAAWKSDSEIVTVATEHGALMNLDAASGDILQENVPFTGPVSSVAWSPNGATLASTGYGEAQYARTWNLVADTLEPALIIPLDQPGQWIRWTQDGDTLITEGLFIRDGLGTSAVASWSSETGSPLDTAKTVAPVDEAPAIGWNSDLTRQAANTPGDNIITLDDLELVTAGPIVKAIQWSPDDAYLATLSASEEPDLLVIEVWSSESGKRISTAVLSGVKEYYPAVFWSNTGALVHIAARTQAQDTYSIYAYTVESGLPRFQYVTPQYYWPKYAYSDDDRTLAIETLTAIVFVDTQTGQPYADQIPAGYINWLDWHGDQLAGASANGTIHIWDVSDLHPPAA
ncbi:MAG: WD40 repeat domain-containing protein [Anaerolineae bacterium]|nr:WD40 repeat domain-containing protein [Anaerolineae bacterium]